MMTISSLALLVLIALAITAPLPPNDKDYTVMFSTPRGQLVTNFASGTLQNMRVDVSQMGQLYEQLFYNSATQVGYLIITLVGQTSCKKDTTTKGAPFLAEWQNATYIGESESSNGVLCNVWEVLTKTDIPDKKRLYANVKTNVPVEVYSNNVLENRIESFNVGPIDPKVFNLPVPEDQCK